MADVSFIRGGTPVFNPFWCDGDYPQFVPPHTTAHLPGTPPFNAHACASYTSGYYTLGMMVNPNGDGMTWQRHALEDKKPKVGDVIDMIVVPEDHYCSAINLKIAECDPKIAGLTVSLVGRMVSYNAENDQYELEDDTTVEEAAEAQGYTAPIAVDKPANVFVSLLKVAGGTVTDGKTAAGYAVPFYVAPAAVTPMPAEVRSNCETRRSNALYLGLKIESMPTDSNVTLAMVRNSWWMSAKIMGFECPTQL